MSIETVKYNYDYIPFNHPLFLEESLRCIEEAVARGKQCGDGYYTAQCHQLLEQATQCRKAFLTTSCSSALEMSSLLCGLQPGDEVIVPSFAFVTTSSAFAMRGAKIVFADIRPDTQNLDENKVEEIISPKTKALVVLHYAGVSCEMDRINSLAQKYGLYIIEDAAQAITSTYRGRACGTLGDFGVYSFHETKNISCGEGGAILVNKPELIKQAEIIREKGTNRASFYRGEIDKYTWLELGSSFLPSDLLAACLYPQLKHMDEIMARRLTIWHRYYDFFERYENKSLVRRPTVPDNCTHNGHMFYLLWPDIKRRTAFIDYLKERGIYSVFHYLPLHLSPGGQKYGRCATAVLPVAEKTADTLVRLPLFYDLSDDDHTKVLDECQKFLDR
ncbi:MAG: dTDP-4-amino-4,6-dideoxygalactose transaminase [Deltaproteobacteria bacterium]|jgi:dTDP-4-amino-4,6-dideoxygalactose transaminase|nr:dTDP-4-amino-4,6-dideoxygalactose transaminase [Deltaproteobacteria bacterium]